MLVEHDMPLLESKLVETTDVLLFPGGFDFEVEHLVEIAVVEVAVPAYRQRIAAHESLYGSGIKSINERLHVIVVVVAFQKIIEETTDGHVGDGVEVVEQNAVFAQKLPFEFSFQSFLVAGQKGA